MLLFLPQIATQIYTVLDKAMLGMIIADKSEVGYYEQAQKMIKLLLTLVTSLSVVMMPRVANLFSEGNMKQIKKYLYRVFAFVFMLVIPMMFGIIAIADDFVPIFFGNGYDKVAISMKIISPILIFVGISYTLGQMVLLPLKKQKELTISVLCGAIINVFLNLLLIPKYQSVGAGVATVIAECCVSIVQLYLVKDLIKIKTIFASFAHYLFVSLIMFCICMLFHFLPIHCYLKLLLQITISIIISFSFLFNSSSICAIFASVIFCILSSA